VSYVILTSKPGLYRTEVTPGLRPVERFDYLFYGVVKARFVIAELLHETRIRVVDEGEPPTVNQVPSKFLERHDSLEAARRALADLTRFGTMDTKLVPA
jgi:hypothetical protein